MISQKFKDLRTGEIVTQIPLSQIEHFVEYEPDFELIPQENGVWFKALSGAALTLNAEIMGEAADPILSGEGVDMYKRLIEAKGMVTAE